MKQHNNENRPLVCCRIVIRGLVPSRQPRLPPNYNVSITRTTPTRAGGPGLSPWA